MINKLKILVLCSAVSLFASLAGTSAIYAVSNVAPDPRDFPPMGGAVANGVKLVVSKNGNSNALHAPTSMVVVYVPSGSTRFN